MKTESRAAPSYGVLHRITRAVCPRDERLWIDAMFAEIDAVEASRRLGWMLGAHAIVLSVIGLRTGLVPGLLWWGIIIGVHSVVVFAIGGRSGFEGFGLDDDVFLRCAKISGVLVIGLVVLAINRIFSHSDARPRT